MKVKKTKQQKKELRIITIMIIFFAFCVGFLIMVGIGLLKSDEILGALFFWILAIVCVYKCVSLYKEHKLARKDFEQYEKFMEKKEKDKEDRRKQEQQRQKEEQRRQIELGEKRRSLASKGIPSCPKCGSTAIATINRGYSIMWGPIGSGKAVNVCQVCGHKFTPGR